MIPVSDQIREHVDGPHCTDEHRQRRVQQCEGRYGDAGDQDVTQEALERPDRVRCEDLVLIEHDDSRVRQTASERRPLAGRQGRDEEVVEVGPDAWSATATTTGQPTGRSNVNTATAATIDERIA